MLDFEDTEEFENATKGLIASPDTLDIYDENGKLVWSQTAYAFLDQDAPDTANPSLWRDTQLNHIYGLFEVTDGIYQVRGYDMSNVTFIKGLMPFYEADCCFSKNSSYKNLSDRL